MRTDETDRALKIIRQTGMDQSQATRWALTLAANMLEYAWLCGHADRGSIPQMKVYYQGKRS
jgi:hypothetical protein